MSTINPIYTRRVYGFYIVQLDYTYRVVISVEAEEFSRRLSSLRIQKGVSAQDMSLSIGQSKSYINNIENCRNLPSMTVFFYICEYLNITPVEFFDIENNNPSKVDSLSEIAKSLTDAQLDTLIALAKEIKR